MLSVSCPRGLAVCNPRSRGRSAVETVQVPGERTPPYSSVSDARFVTRALVAILLVLAYDVFLSGSMPGRRARPVLASPEADGCTTGSRRVRTPDHAPAAEGPLPRQIGRPGLADQLSNGVTYALLPITRCQPKSAFSRPAHFNLLSRILSAAEILAGGLDL